MVDSLTSPEAQEALAPGAPPRVVVVSNVTGAEDIPLTAVAVLSRAPIDLLSHIAIRARGQGTLLAHCADGGVLDEIAAKTGVVDAIVADGSVRVVAVEGDATAGVPGAAKSGGPGEKRHVLCQAHGRV